jgi:hypothetical protein
MKKILFFTLAFLTVSFVNAQTLSSTLNGTFVEGITGVNNMFTVVTPPAQTEYVIFYSTDPTYTDEYDSFQDTDGSDGFKWDADMGNMAPNCVVWAEFRDASDSIIEYSPDYPMNIIATPHWLINGSVSNVQVNGNTISFQGQSTIEEFLYTVPSNVKGFGGKPLNAFGKLKFSSSFDYTQFPIVPNISNERAEVELNILGQGTLSSFVREVPLNEGFLNENYQLSLDYSDSISTPELKLKTPNIPVFVAPGIKVSVDAGLNLYATLKSQVVIGEENGEYGFVERNGKKTKIAGILNGEAFVRGNVKVLFGAASAKASIEGKARLGAGFEFKSIPSYDFEDKIGGDIALYGKISARLLRFIPLGNYTSDNWYYGQFGDTSILRSNLNDGIFNTSSITFRDTGSLVLPTFSPQPSFATRGEMLYTVWIEQDDEKGYILFSKLNSDGTAFSEEKIVYNNSYSISDPKVGILPNGNALITWTQARYNSLNLPLNADLNDLVQSQDIWFAFYDNTTNEISQAYRMPDDESSFQSGRSEGEANICVGDGNEALVTWVATDLSNQTSDIWYSHLTETSGEWLMTDPSKLDDLAGANFNVEVVSTGGNSALAIWMNDPDSDNDSLTYNSNIMFSEWDGNSWTFATELGINDGSAKLKELSIASNAGFVALAWTSTQFFGENDFDNRIDMIAYNTQNSNWNFSDTLSDIDQNYELQKPNVSISNSGKATVTYQVVNMFADSNFISNGALNIYVKDLNTNTQWQQIGDNSNICDTNAFIWELSTGFSAEDRFYVLTQEYTDNGIVTNPVNGVQFGDPELSLVLRGVQINPNLTVSDIEEPGVLPVGIVEKLANPTFKFLNFYPNPFSENTTIEFHLYQNANVQLEIFDFLGNKVTELVNKDLSTGIYKTIFNAGNLPNGIYVSKLTVDGKTAFGKLVLTK